MSIWLMTGMLGLGLWTGFLAGLLGVGGGLMMVPFLTYMLGLQGLDSGIAVKMSIATSMATILFTSLSSVWAHHRRGAVRWKLVVALVPGIVIGGLFAGTAVFSLLKGRGLALFFAVFVGYTAYRMLRGGGPVGTAQLPGPIGLGAVGAGVGFISGLVGAGGGFLTVPFMAKRNVPLHAAVATSAAVGLPIALANTIGYVVGGWGLPAALPGAFGYLYLPALGLITLGSISTAPLGAKVAHALNVQHLRRVFGYLLLAIACYMLTVAIRG